MEKRRRWQHLPSPLTSRRSSVEKSCSAATHARVPCREKSGRSRVCTVQRSQPSTNPHHLPGFESLNSSLHGSVLDPAPEGVPAKPIPKDIVHHLLFTSSMLYRNILCTAKTSTGCYFCPTKKCLRMAKSLQKK